MVQTPGSRSYGTAVLYHPPSSTNAGACWSPPHGLREDPHGVHIINELFKYAQDGMLEDRIYAVYVSPLKALANDINKNLEELAQMHELAQRKGIEFPKVRVGVRSGDTSPSKSRAAAHRRTVHHHPRIAGAGAGRPQVPGEVLPGGVRHRGREYTRCDSKRECLSITLEAAGLARAPSYIRIGLSATPGPHRGDRLPWWDARTVTFVPSSSSKCRPSAWTWRWSARRTGPPCRTRSSTRMWRPTGIWWREHQTTLIFTNTRSRDRAGGWLRRA